MIATIKPKTMIRPVTEDDFQIIRNLAELRFGKGYLHYEEFRRWLNYPELFSLIEVDGEFAGYLCFLEVTAAEMAASIKLPVADIEASAQGKKVIHCRSMALLPEFEGKGNMRLLWEHNMKKAKATGAKVAYCPAWKYNGFVPMHKLLTAFGFEILCEQGNIWFDDKEYCCIICGGPCVCPAVIYRYEF